jgi:hypothetical protein
MKIVKARRISSRQVVLTATFLALAAGGTAACDDPSDEEWESSTVYDSSDSSGFSGYSEPDDSEVDDEANDEADDVVVDDGTEVFYCADEEGEIVDADMCDESDPAGSYFLWHSTGYARNLRPGAFLDGGDNFAPSDRASRRAFKLPATGKVSNGTIKTNVVGSGSSGRTSSGLSSGGGTSSGG